MKKLQLVQKISLNCQLHQNSVNDRICNPEYSGTHDYLNTNKYLCILVYKKFIVSVPLV